MRIDKRFFAVFLFGVCLLAVASLLWAAAPEKEPAPNANTLLVQPIKPTADNATAMSNATDPTPGGEVVLREAGNAPTSLPSAGATPGVLADTNATAAIPMNDNATSAGNVPLKPMGTLEEFTLLRTELERVRLLVAIKEEGRRLKELSLPVLPGVPGQSGTAGVAPVARKPRPKPRPKVISIQGVEGDLCATVHQPGVGVVDVRAGDRLGGGKVESITLNRVVVRYGAKKRTLGFKE